MDLPKLAFTLFFWWISGLIFVMAIRDLTTINILTQVFHQHELSFPWPSV